MKDIQDFDSIKIRLASPEQIKAWSYGEVKKPETINYRTLRPERDGLFCEKIFGTTKEWECYCGKFKSIRYKGVVCDRCGVEVTNTKVRRERMGHITLASPVSHIWYYRSSPSRMSLVLGITKTGLHSVLYYEKYIVINPGDTELKAKQILTEDEYYRYREQYGDTFRAGMGAEAIRELLCGIDLEALAKELRDEMHRNEKNKKGDSNKKLNLLKRIEVVENFRDSGNRPEWMVLTVIPVIPPDLRPMVQLDGGRFATSDLNDLYRRVINRNNRLKRLLALHAPDIIVRNEKRMLQEAVDALFDNSSRKKVVKGASNRPLKSLSDMLKGKQGRFRQNLLGKRVDYSGRSVIVIGPELRLHQCGLPSKMALELYKPFLMKKLVQQEIVPNIKRAKTCVEQEAKEVWSILDEVVKEHPVLLNRAPTLHRLGIQAFEPVLVDGKAIKLHPLVCHAFNADFDGDQMAVHVPLTLAAQLECWTIMLSATNLLDPANGKPIVYPSQDMVLGINYLTRAMEGAHGEGKYFDNIGELYKAIDAHSITYNTKIWYKLPEGVEIYPKPETDSRKIWTTPGRIIFNDVLPKGIPFQNMLLGDKELKRLIAETLHNKPNSTAVKLLDAIKDVGFKYATLFGATISLSDMIVPESKKDIIEEANRQEAEIVGQFKHGVISKEERYNKIIDIWSQANDKLSDELMSQLKKSQNGFNPLYLMADSGARGSKTQIRQLGGMRGLMSKPSGEIIEFPIKSNFKEGLSIIEFFISTNGARKGLADTALKTSKAGHLTRRLVDVSQDVVVNEDDCGTINGIERRAIKDGDEVIESLASRIIGRYTLENVCHPITGEKIIGMNEEITEEVARKIEEAGIESVYIRTVLTCESKHGVCRKCYGHNLSNNRPVDIGEAVGTIAAQSIGQPGTQLTMRTFHVGGTASTSTEDNKITLTHDAIINTIKGNIVTREDGARLFTRKGFIWYARVLNSYDAKKVSLEEGKRVLKGDDLGGGFTAENNGIIRIVDGKACITLPEQRIEIKEGSEVKVEAGQFLEAGNALVIFDPFSEPIIAEQSGRVGYKDIVSGTTLIEEFIEESGDVIKRISDHVYQNLEPEVQIFGENDELVASYLLPGGSLLQVDDGQDIKIGEIIAKMPKAGIKTKDITGGLPRVEELVEARIPSNPAVLAQVEGVVKFNGVERNRRSITITDDFGHAFKHYIPLAKHVLVRDGDRVEAADRLCDGAEDPHDILDILGEGALQSFILEQIQDVYRVQGVDINDKHLGIIVRQMLRKVQIYTVGDTNFVQNQLVDKFKFREENERVIANGGEAAVARPILQGITKAALSNSFIAAASFQETTKVLTNAAIAGSTDELRGLKENVVIGHIIPAGTGMKKYRSVQVTDEDAQILSERVQSVMGARQAEAAAADDFNAEELADMTLEGEPEDVVPDVASDEE